MPRTKAAKLSVRNSKAIGKQSYREQEKSIEDDIYKFGADQRHEIDSIIQMETRNIELAFNILLGSYSNSVFQKTMKELKTEIYLKEEPSILTRHSSRAVSRDDGYLTENSSQSSGDRGLKKPTVTSSSSRSTRRSRSADARRAQKPPPTVQSNRSRSVVYRTPAYNKNASNNYPVITPKVTPQTPLTVLRQPRQGEMVVSMSGSPVMVPSCYTMQPEEKANCNILLRDGTMLSLQPKQLRQSQAYIPFSLMDDNVLLQLKTLKENLDKVVKLGEKQLK